MAASVAHWNENEGKCIYFEKGCEKRDTKTNEQKKAEKEIVNRTVPNSSGLKYSL